MKYIISLLALVLLNCSSKNEEQPQNTHPSWSPNGTMIAFINNAEGVQANNAIDFEVFSVNLDGSELTQHTFNDAFEAGLAWSNDGTKLAFKSYRDGNDEVYILNFLNGDQTNISNHSGRDGSPFFVGEQLFFNSERDHDQGEIYRFDLTTNSVERVTFNDFTESSFILSSDGSLIIFVSNMDGDDDLYLMKSDGDSLVQLTDNPLNDWYPRLSPDGTTLMYTYGDWETDEWQLRTLDLFSLEEQLILEGNDSGNATWSPSGEEIAYGSSKKGSGHIYVYNLLSKNIKQLTK